MKSISYWDVFLKSIVDKKGHEIKGMSMNNNNFEAALFIGGNALELNPPKKLLTPQVGFEDQK